MRYTPPIPEESGTRIFSPLSMPIPPGFGAVLLLADVQEFLYGEIAGILGVPIGSVMSRLSLGRELSENRIGRPGALLRNQTGPKREYLLGITRFFEHPEGLTCATCSSARSAGVLCKRLDCCEQGGP